ncbi:MAG: hypothetical protein HY693_04025, partial [Deltaproteobacteria bacterium]|nr:hypothetical protein [Deltaproteobacteria bacterium]
MRLSVDLDTLTLEELQEFKEEIQCLKKQVEEKETEHISRQFRGQKVLGFKLTLAYCRSSWNGKRYPAWKANYYHEGNRYIVHIGKDPRKAKQKIAQYL